MTMEEFLTLPIVEKALWMDATDPRCGFMVDERGVSWIIGFDGDVLSRASRDGGLTAPAVPDRI